MYIAMFRVDSFNRCESIDLPDSDLKFWASIDLQHSNDFLVEALTESIEWRQETIKLFGRSHLQPRLSAWYGDTGLTYRYSGIKLNALPWTDLLQSIKQVVETVCGSTFNSLLLNYYRDQCDSMGMHSDDEVELGVAPSIASLSLGAERYLRLKHKFRKDLKPTKLLLPSGCLLLMSGDTQAYWKHGVSKQAKPCGPRINLTFRRVIPV